MTKSILFVDDEPAVLEALSRALQPAKHGWELTCVTNPETAWHHLLDAAYDAVVTDIQMPGTSGLDLLARIRQTVQTKDVPVVLFTGMQDPRLKQQALELGASDLLQKPVDTGQLIARLHNAVSLKDEHDHLKASHASLRCQVKQQCQELLRSRLDALCHLANAAEYRDEETGNHVVRVGCYARVVAERLGWDEDSMEMLLLAAPLHDIGKIGIPDSILRKCGPLSPGERAAIERHCIIGERILREPSRAMLFLFDWYSVTPFDGPTVNRCWKWRLRSP